MHKRLDATAALLALLLAASAAQAGWDRDDQPRDDRRHGEGEIGRPCSYRRGCGGPDAYRPAGAGVEALLHTRDQARKHQARLAGLIEQSAGGRAERLVKGGTEPG